jgi:hypothetical protein
MSDQDQYKAYTAGGKARVDWWILAAAFRVLIDQAFSPMKIDVDEEPLENGIEFEVYSHTDKGEYIEVALFGVLALTANPKPGRSTLALRTEPISKDDLRHWLNLISQLRAFASQAHHYHRMTSPSINKVLDAYYRLKKAGEKVTLKQLAAQANISYAYLRKSKITYDQNLKGNKHGNKDMASE